uniref:Uncharacterized protein n=1 Tax=Heterorhabditis bacteriophora TaxID=37862 RepID=A0A1I7WNG9_HETBA
MRRGCNAVAAKQVGCAAIHCYTYIYHNHTMSLDRAAAPRIWSAEGRQQTKRDGGLRLAQVLHRIRDEEIVVHNCVIFGVTHKRRHTHILLVTEHNFIAVPP